MHYRGKWLLTFTLKRGTETTYVLNPTANLLTRHLRLIAENSGELQYEAIVEREDHAIVVQANLREDARILHHSLTRKIPDYWVEFIESVIS